MGLVQPWEEFPAPESLAGPVWSLPGWAGVGVGWQGPPSLLFGYFGSGATAPHWAGRGWYLQSSSSSFFSSGELFFFFFF